MLSVNESNAALAKELAEDAQKELESLLTSGDPNAPKVLSPKASSVDNQTGSNVSTGPELGSDGRPADPCSSRKEAIFLLIPTNRTKSQKGS